MGRRAISRIIFVGLCLVSTVFLTSSILAGGGPRDVAVIINADSAVSCEIGEYYRAARNIPKSNVCMIHCPEQEIVSKSVCESTMLSPIRQFLSQPEVAGKIDYIVMTKGMPLAADYGDSSGVYSISSILTCIDNSTITSCFVFPYGPCANLVWSESAPETAWSHSIDFYGYHFYLITRLDAFTVDQVKAMIDRSLAPAHSGLFVLDKNNYNSMGACYAVANDRLGNGSGSAYDLLTQRGISVDYDPDKIFISNQQNVMGYFSWSSNDEYYTFEKYTSNSFLPGSIGDTYYSYSGRTFTDPGTTARSPLIADLIGCGLCGAGGYVSEPFVTDATYPNVLFDRYTKGYNMAESFFAGCAEVFWKTVVVGDPLMAAYATPPSVALKLPGNLFSGSVTIAAEANDPNGISMVKFYIDDDLISTQSLPPFSVTFDSSHYADGSHTVEAIAYENAATATQGFSTQAITIDNSTSAQAKIGNVFNQADSLRIRLDGLVVTAGSGEVGDGFFIEENDRTAGIEVLSDVKVARGDIVSVVGNVGTLNGVKVIQNASIMILKNGGAVPRPVLMNLNALGGSSAGCVIPVGRSYGLRSVGLLVKTYGRVTAAGQNYFYISDGRRRNPPVKVYCSSASLPSVGQSALVIGICDSEYDTPYCAPIVRVRDPSDISPYGP